MNAQNVANLLQSMRQQSGGPTSSAPMGMPGQAAPPVNIASMLTAIRNSIGPNSTMMSPSNGNMGPNQ
jgi:hypothetical protein